MGKIIAVISTFFLAVLLISSRPAGADDKPFSRVWANLMPGVVGSPSLWVDTANVKVENGVVHTAEIPSISHPLRK